LSVALEPPAITRSVRPAATPIHATVSRLRASFESGHTRGLGWRREQLEGLCRMLRDRRADLAAAIHADLGKPKAEVEGGELAQAAYEARFALRKLGTWTAPERIGSLSLPGRRAVHREPVGVVLIASPWCHPVGLLLAPLAGAIAAGNCAVLRPPTNARHTARLLSRLVVRYLDPDAIVLIDGDDDTAIALFEERFDHIFFMGSGAMGRVATDAGSRHATPTTIELVGKSPCLVDSDVDIRDVARQIAFGKFFHAGQTSAAPDYVLVPERCERPLIDALGNAIRETFGKDPSRSPHYARIENPEQRALLESLRRDGEVAIGGEARPADGYIPPTVLRNVSPTAAILSAEVLGPILPVLRVPGITEAIDFVNDRDHPLALYVFAGDEDTQELVVEQTRSRGVCVNGIPGPSDRALPLGDIGASGVGAHHGRSTFETFSRRTSVLDRSRGFESRQLYPAYNRLKTRLVYWRL
jgi:aldehyde dehydrogenase (NAD+)